MDSIKSLIFEIKKRPIMYLSTRSIFSLKAFLDGWFLRGPDSVEDISVIEGFQRWIEEKYEIRTSHSWCHIIFFYSQDEFDALEIFFKEFDLFLEKGSSKS